MSCSGNVPKWCAVNSPDGRKSKAKGPCMLPSQCGPGRWARVEQSPRLARGQVGSGLRVPFPSGYRALHVTSLPSPYRVGDIGPSAFKWMGDQFSLTTEKIAGDVSPVAVAIAPSKKTPQDLLFSCGVAPVPQPAPPASWSWYVQDWVRRNGLSGGFMIFIQGPSNGEPDANHRFEIINLASQQNLSRTDRQKHTARAQSQYNSNNL